jgi:hypothetical protein
MSSIVIITSANFRPAHYSWEIEEKLRKIAQMYWTEEAARWQLGQTKDHASAVALQRIQQQRRALIGTLPALEVIQGGKQ